jgi:hypothetical protein
MTRCRILFLIVLATCLAAGCTTKHTYKLNVYGFSPEGTNTLDEHEIHASNDSAAYSEATVIYLLAVRAYNRTDPNGQPYINKPVSYSVLNENGNSVDSILGVETIQRIQEAKRAVIN